MHDHDEARLVWVTRRYAINPAALVSVFYGTTGQIQLHLFGNDVLDLFERDLTEAGRLLLLPSPKEHSLPGGSATHSFQQPVQAGGETLRV